MCTMFEIKTPVKEIIGWDQCPIYTLCSLDASFISRQTEGRQYNQQKWKIMTSVIYSLWIVGRNGGLLFSKVGFFSLFHVSIPCCFIPIGLDFRRIYQVTRIHQP